MAAKMPELNYACEICGLEGLNEESMREHMMSNHLEGASSCFFCDFGDISPEELLIHINTVHLDYLTPENEMLDFIDDDKFETMPESFRFESHHDKNINLSNNNNSNVNNNNNNIVNEIPTSSGGAGAKGSPLRTQLNLNLKENIVHSPSRVQNKKHKCMLCGYNANSSAQLEEHINRDHFDMTSPSALASNPSTPAKNFRCPLCIWSFQNSQDLEFHVNVEHKDILSPAKVK